MCRNQHATTTSTVTVPQDVLNNYRSVYNRAEAAASQPFKAFGNTASDYVAQLNAQQNAGIADINATAGSYQPYMTQATSATQAGMGPAYEGIQNYMSPYTKNVADTTGAMMRQQQEQAQSGALGTAAMSGAFGGDRAGIAAANLQQQNQMGYGKTMADIMNQGYTQALGASQADLARQLQGGAQMAQLGAQSQQLGLQGAQAKIAAGTLQQQTEQAGKDAMINRFMQQQGLPYQQAQFLANIAMGTGALSGSTTTTATPRNFLGFEAGGRVNGYADGGGVAGPMEYSKLGIGIQGYVPEANLPVGQLMIAEPPQDQGGSGGGQMIKLAEMAMGAARGGVIGANHGYASGGVAGDRHGYAGGGGPAAWYQGLGQSHMVPTVTDADTATQAPNVAPPEDLPRLNFGLAAHASGSPATAAGVVPQRPAATANANLPLSAGLKPVQHVEPSPIQPNAGLAPAHQPNKRDADLNMVAQRESGNDADALYGFANREGGPFAGTKVTNMTVDQAIDFAKPGGAYANYSLDKLGRIATPMGKYQIVGRTLQQAKDDLGLTGNEIMTEDLQKRIAEHLYDTSGLSPWASSMGGGGGGDNTGVAAGEKPYEQRNAVGKFFHNPDGGMNRNAILSLLAGIGHAAEAPTISPLGAIISGVGYGADAYNKLQNEEPKRVADIMANNANARLQYQTQVALGERRPFEQWAKDQFSNGAQSMVGAPTGNVSPVDQITGGKSFMGVPLDKTGGGFSAPIQLPDNKGTILASQSYAYNSQLAAEVAKEASLGIPFAVNTLTQAKANMAAIEANNGLVQTVDGKTAVDPTYNSVQFGSTKVAADTTRSGEIYGDLPSMLKDADTSIRTNQELTEALKGSAGMSSFAPILNKVGSMASALGISKTDYPDDYQFAYKVLGQEAAGDLSKVAGKTDTSIYSGFLTAAQPTPEMAPGAIEKILAIRSGTARFKYDLAKTLNDAAQSGQSNLAEVERNFSANNPLSKYVDEEMPKFAGKIPRASEAPQEGDETVNSRGEAIIFDGTAWRMK